MSVRLSQFINDHVLSKFNVRAVRASSLRQILRSDAELREQLQSSSIAYARLSQIEARLDELKDALTGTLTSFDASIRQLSSAIEARFSALKAMQAQTSDDLARRLSELESRVAERRTLLSPFEGAASQDHQIAMLRVAHHFSPKKAVGHNKVRVGRPNDGGYVMLDDFEGIAGAFSFGVGDDASWDLAIARRGIPVYQYDFVAGKSPVTHDNLHFTHRRIVPDSAEDGVTIAALLQEREKVDGQLILKMDIEHDEWAVFDRVDPEDLRHFAQLICEFHGFERAVSRTWSDRALRVMGKLVETFQVIHVHGNNYMPFVSIGNVAFPSVIEVTFANRARYGFGECCEIFPTTLDDPNGQHAADLFLGRFQY